jgi:hypothetical protein
MLFTFINKTSSKQIQLTKNQQIMKTKIIYAIVALALFAGSTIVNAAVWRVNGTPNSSAHYSTLQAAHDNAATQNGDTIYLEGSMFPTGGLSCSKQLTIIGSGYFLNQNPETQHNKYPSTIDGYVYFYVGSAGSKIIGCSLVYSIYLYTTDISIERNYFGSMQFAVYGYTGDNSNTRIINNYFENVYYYYSIYFSTPSSNVLISNNYINGYIYTTSNFSGMVMNNIFASEISFYNSNVINNISIYNSASLTNCIVTHNIGTGTQFPAQGNNQQNILQSNIFVGLTGNSPDGQWQLKPLSPAIGAGEDGVDCGIFGGAYPYKLSGMPPIPAIYDFDAPSLPSGTISVSLKAKSHN